MSKTRRKKTNYLVPVAIGQFFCSGPTKYDGRGRPVPEVREYSTFYGDPNNTSTLISTLPTNQVFGLVLDYKTVMLPYEGKCYTGIAVRVPSPTVQEMFGTLREVWINVSCGRTQYACMTKGFEQSAYSKPQLANPIRNIVSMSSAEGDLRPPENFAVARAPPQLPPWKGQKKNVRGVEFLITGTRNTWKTSPRRIFQRTWPLSCAITSRSEETLTQPLSLM